MAVFGLMLCTSAFADSGSTANNWGSFDPDHAIKTMAELPMYVLRLIRWTFIILSVGTIIYLVYALGAANRRKLAGVQIQNKPPISFGQFLTGIAIAVLLWSFAESLSILQVTKGVLEGGGTTVIEHPLGYVDESTDEYGWVLLKTFVMNSVNLIGFSFIANSLKTWQEINLGYSQERLMSQFWKFMAGAGFMSFEWTYRFICATLGIGDPLGILFT